jgi:hypothetical protein
MRATKMREKVIIGYHHEKTENGAESTTNKNKKKICSHKNL